MTSLEVTPDSVCVRCGEFPQAAHFRRRKVCEGTHAGRQRNASSGTDTAERVVVQHPTVPRRPSSHSLMPGLTSRMLSRFFRPVQPWLPHVTPHTAVVGDCSEDSFLGVCDSFHEELNLKIGKSSPIPVMMSVLSTPTSFLCVVWRVGSGFGNAPQKMIISALSALSQDSLEIPSKEETTEARRRQRRVTLSPQGVPRRWLLLVGTRFKIRS